MSGSRDANSDATTRALQTGRKEIGCFIIMKASSTLILTVVASMVVSAGSALCASASKLSTAPSAPYEAWSTHKTMTVSAAQAKALPGLSTGARSSSSVEVRTINGNEQTLKLGKPLGKL